MTSQRNTLVSIKSPYQWIKIVGFPNWTRHTLYLDRAFQYDSFYEYKYHELIADFPAISAEQNRRALICGGGDGLAARELLKYFQEVYLVEIDPDMIRLFSTNEELRKINGNAYSHPNLKVVCGDAIEFAQKTDINFDVVILDFPSPSEANSDKEYAGLWSNNNLQTFAKLVDSGGVLASMGSLPNVLFMKIASFFKVGLKQHVYDVGFSYDGQSSGDEFIYVSKFPLSIHRKPIACRFLDEIKANIIYDERDIDDDSIEYWKEFFFYNVHDEFAHVGDVDESFEI